MDAEWHPYNSIDGILFDEGSNGQMYLKINWGPPHQPTWTIYDEVNDTEAAIMDFHETCHAYFAVYWTGLADVDPAFEPWRIEGAEFDENGHLLVLVRQEPGLFPEWSSVLELQSLNPFYEFFNNVFVAIPEGWVENPVHPNWHHPLLPALEAVEEDDDVQIIAVIQHDP